MQVTVTIGPLAAESARAWLESARRTLAILRERLELGIPEDVIAAFERYARAWGEAAEGDVFEWSEDLEAATVRRLAAHWLTVATTARDRPELGISLPGPEAQAFYDALVVALATAAAADDEDERFAPKFEEAVPEFLAGPALTKAAPSRSVLIVDDNDDIRLLLRLTLQREYGLEVYAEATNGQEAVDACSAACPDVVLLDVSMPVMDGLTALPLLKERCPHTEVVVFSANDRGDWRQRALELGARAFVPKTASMAEVAAALTAA